MFSRQDVVEGTLNELAWLGALQLSLKLHQSSIDDLTADLLKNPSKYAARIGPGVNVLASHARFKPNTQPGHYRNKTALIYLVSVLEVFLRKVCLECLNLSTAPKMFGALLGWCEFERVMPGFCVSDEVKRVHLVRLVRNAIVHHDGKVPPDFWSNSTSQCDSAERYISAWPNDKAQFRQYYQPGNDVWLHIDEVVMPAVLSGVKFAEYVNTGLGRLGVC